jgi:hypothetical protein
MTARRAAFERAVADYRLPDLAPPAKALAVAAASLDRTGLFLLGEAHGVAQTPLAILGLAQRLGARALAFEWSYEIEGQRLDAEAPAVRIEIPDAYGLSGFQPPRSFSRLTDAGKSRAASAKPGWPSWHLS